MCVSAYVFLGSHIGYERIHERGDIYPHNSPSVKDSSVCEENRVLSGSGEISTTHPQYLFFVIITHSLLLLYLRVKVKSLKL